MTWNIFSHRATGKAAKVQATWSLLIGYLDPSPQLTCSSVSRGWVDCKRLQLQPTVFRLVAAVQEGEGLRDLRVCIPRLVTGYKKQKQEDKTNWLTAIYSQQSSYDVRKTILHLIKVKVESLSSEDVDENYSARIQWSDWLSKEIWSRCACSTQLSRV